MLHCYRQLTTHFICSRDQYIDFKSEQNFYILKEVLARYLENEYQDLYTLIEQSPLFCTMYIL